MLEVLAIAILVVMVWIVNRAHERTDNSFDGMLISTIAVCAVVGIVFAPVHGVDRQPSWIARTSQAQLIR